MEKTEDLEVYCFPSEEAKLFCTAIAEENVHEISKKLDSSEIGVNQIVATGGPPELGCERTPLMLAAEIGKVSVLGVLVEKGADVNESNSSGETPLTCAAHGGHEEACKVLVENKGNIHSAISDNWPPLLWAAFSGHTEVCRYLLQSGADANYGDSMGGVLMYAAEEGHEEVCKLLLQNGAEVDLTKLGGNTALMKAAKNGKTEICLMLIQNDANVNYKNSLGYTALMAAAGNGQTETCVTLIKNGASIKDRNNFGETAIDMAVNWGRHETATAMKSAAADQGVCQQEEQAGSQEEDLQTASTLEEWKKAIRQMVDALTAPLDRAEEFTEAVKVKNYNRINDMLDKEEINVNAVFEKWVPTDSDKTPLAVAAECGEISICELLLNRGANVDQCHENCPSPLHHASSGGYREICQLLIKNRANINAVSFRGTPLMWACATEFRNDEVCQILLENGANVNYVDEHGREPLRMAAIYGHKELCQLLVEYGADTGHIDGNGKTVIGTATMLGKDEIVKAIEKAAEELKAKKQSALKRTAKSSNRKNSGGRNMCCVLQ